MNRRLHKCHKNFRKCDTCENASDFCIFLNVLRGYSSLSISCITINYITDPNIPYNKSYIETILL